MLIGRRFHATLDFEMGRISEGAETFPGGKTGVLAVTQLYTCRCHFRCDANFVYIFIFLDVPKLTRVFVECIISHTGQVHSYILLSPAQLRS